MADIQPYVRVLFLRKFPKGMGLPSAYLRREDVIDVIKNEMIDTLKEYGVVDAIDVSSIAYETFEKMLSADCFVEISDEFAGKYYRHVVNNMENFRQSLLSASDLNGRAESIGEARYFGDVFSAFVNGETEIASAAGLSLAIPASDRVVTLNHNQQTAIDPPLSSLIDDVRSDNEVLDDGVKERLLGQLRAGQELVRAGSVRAFLLYHTLVRGLMELVARYRGRAIAVAAERLIELLIEHIFQGGA